MGLSAEDRDALRRLEETLWRVETRYDRALMERTFAAEFAEIGRSGRRYMRDEMFFDPDPTAEIGATLPLPEYAVTLIAEDVALATYTSEVRHEGAVLRARRSSLWAWRDARWQLCFHQGTPC